MRTSINEDILKFKNKIKILKCNICNKTNTDFHVDHDTPSFNQLKNNFLNEHKTDNLTFKKNEKFRTIFDNDSLFEKDWIIYHNKYATLQLLCQTCNLTKTRI
jgi:uncharacterized membrane protein YfhO